MAIRIEVYDGITPMLDFIAERSYGLARQVLTEAGMDIRDAVIHSAKDSTQTHNWFHGSKSDIPKSKSVSGVKNMGRGRYVWKDTSRRRRLGTATNTAKSSPNFSQDNIFDILTSYIAPEGGLSVTIGGSHKAFTPIKYKDGEPVGTYSPVKKRGASTKAIFHKLDTGEVNRDHPYYLRHAKGGYETRHNQYQKSRDVFAMGELIARTEVTKKMATAYNKVLPRVVNNASIKVKRINTRATA